MHREPLLELLAGYRNSFPGEAATIDRIAALVEARPDCFSRTCLPGHVTASCWILSPDSTRFLLTHHRKLGRWLQLGGHADGDPDARAVALREAREESGLRDFEWLTGRDGLLPLDVDVHTIPAHGREPAHEHHDIRFLLRAGAGQRLRQSEESLDLRWFDDSEAPGVLSEESLLRLHEKARVRLAGLPGGRPDPAAAEGGG